MSQVTRFYKIIEPRSEPYNVLDNQDISGNAGLFGTYTWYHRLVQGSASRTIRYKEYDIMDADTDVSAALDIIAEEILGNNPKSKLPLDIEIVTENEQIVPSALVVTVKAALRTWCVLQDWNKRLFQTVRKTIKYGDAFFLRPTQKKFDKLLFIHPKNVVGAIVPEDNLQKILAWSIKTDFRNATGMPGINAELSFTGSTDSNAQNISPFSANDVVRFTLNSDMSDEAPFGESILKSIYRTFKQKELLEDSVLIYRIQRAPERRVFQIDVGRMHPAKVAAYLQQIKDEFRQRKVPSYNGGKSTVESVYNPQTQNEDFFFAKRPDGSGSSVDVLPSGQNLGELQDLEYFYKKMWRGLRIPQSYMDANADGGQFNDGTVGVAYMQEIIFTLMIERIQKQIEATLDQEFKRFLYEQGIKVDNTVFKVVLPPPSNFAKSKQQQIDGALIQTYQNIKDDKTLSPRFMHKRFLGLSEEEIILNQRLKLEELGINPDKATKADLIRIYNPDDAELGGMDGGLGGNSDLSNIPIDAEMSEEDLESAENDEIESEDSAIESNNQENNINTQ